MISEADPARILDELITGTPYALEYYEKQKRLLPLLESQVEGYLKALPLLQRYCDRMSFVLRNIKSYEEVPYLPVSIFKKYNLSTVPDSEIVRVLTSSGTTGQIPSRIYLDKRTAFRQSKALTSTLSHFLGKTRRPFLVLDVPESNQEAHSITARGAAIRGISMFASTITFGLMEQEDHQIVPNLEVLERFFSDNRDKEVLIFGFTYLVWIHTVQYLRRLGTKFDSPGAILLHSGGWKKLTDLKVEKEVFNEIVSNIFGMSPKKVLDFYGLVEQVGVVFVDCEAGNKHSPNFAEVLIRDILTFKRVEPGQQGLIEILSVLPASYPGQAIVTEDIGTLLGYDNCSCGRKGIYFRFRSRAEKAEVRGCGDTFATARVIG